MTATTKTSKPTTRRVRKDPGKVAVVRRSRSSQAAVKGEVVKRDLSEVEVARAAEIIREYEAGLASARSAVEHAYRAGELLIEARKHLKHGEWLPWLEATFEFTPRTAQTWIKLAAYFPDAKSASHFLTVEAASRHISESRRIGAEDPTPQSEDERLYAECNRLAAQIERAKHIEQQAEQQLADLLREPDEAVFEKVVQRTRLSEKRLRALRQGES